MKKFFKSLVFLTSLFCFVSCGDTDNNQQDGQPIEEMPVMDSRVKLQDEVGFLGEPLNSDYIGYFGGAQIVINTYPSEQAECNNSFVISFSYPQGNYDYWILSQDMVLHKISPVILRGCAVVMVPTEKSMIVCDDTAEGNLKEKIDFNSIRSHTDPNRKCGW
jgi:hypothetical protein